MDNNMPISQKIEMALRAKQPGLAEKILRDSFAGIAEQFMQVAKSYDESDLPFVVWAMASIESCLKNTLNEDGRGIVDQLMERTACMVIDEEELQKQLEEDGYEEE